MFQNKISKLTLAFFVGSLSVTAIAAPGAQFTEVNIQAEHVFMPKGFDTNDSAQVMVTGYLPNLCYKAPKVTSKVIGKEVHLTVTAMKNVDPNALCAQMWVPFLEVANVGMLKAADYKIKVDSQIAPLPMASTLVVAEAQTSATDDFVYANVERVETFKNSHKVVLHGYSPSDCFELDQVKMLDNGSDTFSVLPIMKQVHEACPMKMTPFSYEATVPESLSAEKILLHVRVLNGKSVNALFFNVNEIGR